MHNQRKETCIMICKPSTSEIMDIFNSATEKAEMLHKEIDSSKSKISKRINIVEQQLEYLTHQALTLNNRLGTSEGKIVFADADKAGNFDQFGMTIHPRLLKTPRNLFNFKSTNGYLFRDNVYMLLNNDKSTELTESLKHDDIAGKEYYIDEYDSPELTLEVKADMSAVIGSMNFNVIEIAPFLPGSFNIESIDIYSKDNINTPSHQLSNGMVNVGNQRIILTDKTEVARVVIKIRIIYQNSHGKYPFGLKHLYLLDADFDPASYIVVREDKKKEISYIYDNIVLKNQFGSDTTASSSEYGIKYYASYDGNDTFEQELETSKSTDLSFVSINTKTVFVYIPLNTSLIAVNLNISTDEVK